MVRALSWSWSSTRIVVAASFSLLVLLFLVAFSGPLTVTELQLLDRPITGRWGPPLRFANRKLLGQDSGKINLKKDNMNNSSSSSNSAKPMIIGEGCSPEDIVIYQGATSPLPNGVPTYTVQILNECLDSGAGSSCRIAFVHLSCGWFSSFRLVNPRLFRRLRFNDCLVNDGRPIPPGSSVAFQYANSFPYPLSLSKATCI